jgi:MoCo/4Fe-4S cofactor protein with predicted Tat translocation signal
MSLDPHDLDRLDLAAVRARLADKTGPAFWRSLDEIVETPGFEAFIEAELPRHAAAMAGAGRRHFLKLMAASLGLAGLAACTRQPLEEIVPYTTAPDGWVSGVPHWFATAVSLEGWGFGVLAESHEGRPTKLEGNPDHPASLGGADTLTQAAVLELYDPDRSQAVLHRGEISPWSALVDELGQVRKAQLARHGRGLRLLTGNVTSPTLIAQIERLLAELPDARWHVWESAGRTNVYAGARLAFGASVETHYRLELARTILTLDADLFGRGPGRVRHAKDVARGRKVRTPDGEMSRLWVVESCPTTVGAVADERLAVRSSDVDAIARAVAAGLGVRVATDAGHPVVRAHRQWIEAVVRDLRRSGRAAAVVAGEGQPPAVHAIAHAINERLGAVGVTVQHTEPFAAAARDDVGTLAELVADARAGAVEALVILDANPVYDAPADLDVSGALDALPFVAHAGLHVDETANRAHWHVPMAHTLESWSDLRADDGTVTVVQPLVAPLYDGRTLHEVLGVLTGTPGTTPHALVRAHWLERLGGERAWRHALRDGVVPGTEAPVTRRRLVAGLSTAVGTSQRPAPGIEVAFRPDAGVWDGRFANNAWLQEVSRPMTLLTWDNAALLAPATAERLGVTNGDVVTLEAGGRGIEVPVWVAPGHAQDAVTLALGYGRTRAGRVGTGVGADVAPLRTSEALDVLPGITIRPAGRRHALATTQSHHRMEGREPVRMATLDAFHADPHVATRDVEPHPERTSLYPPHPYDGHAWGMVIDVGACIGCNACVTACVAENNIAIVGREQVLRGREMHWIRVDRYYTGDLDAPGIVHQPVPCMHCENAPCELVCPVNATVHSSEGLNEMVYNRCVGTRYCSNNCPYKVRRFNFYLFSDWTTESLKLQRNPEVTVRSRGVMEKCSYCVQRIEAKRALAKREDRSIHDGEIVPACQQTCPADAIVFGDLNDGDSRVARLRQDPLHYALLGELDTRPRTTYLAGLRNPSPDGTKDEPA